MDVVAICKKSLTESPRLDEACRRRLLNIGLKVKSKKNWLKLATTMAVESGMPQGVTRAEVSAAIGMYCPLLL